MEDERLDDASALRLGRQVFLTPAPGLYEVEASGGEVRVRSVAFDAQGAAAAPSSPTVQSSGPDDQLDPRELARVQAARKRRLEELRARLLQELAALRRRMDAEILSGRAARRDPPAAD